MTTSEPDAVSGLAAALADVAGTAVELERPSDAAHGDYATNVALRLAGGRKQAPREVAEELATGARELEGVERVEVAGPGFLNLFLDDAWFGRALEGMLEAGPSYGAGSPAAPLRIQVEMVSANPTGPLTVGHARNGAFGDSVARLLELAGHVVEREYYYNDAGGQMERFRASVEAARRGEEPPEDGYQGDYVRDLAALEGDPVPHMLERIEATLERFRIHFDTRALQSELEVRLRRVPASARHVRAGRRRLGPVLRVRRRRRLGARPLRGAGRPAHVSSRRRRLSRRQARPGLRPGDLRARRRPPRDAQVVRGRSRACSATSRSGSRCCSTSSST